MDGGLERGLLDAPTPSGSTSPSSRTPSTATRRSTSRVQRRQENSLLNWTKRLIQVRRSTRVFGRGTIEFLKPANHRVLAYVRSLDSEKVLVVNNLSSTAQAVELDLARAAPAPSPSRCSAAASSRGSASGPT